MSRREKCLGLFGFIMGALAAAGWRIYSRRPRERCPSFEELDDPEVAAAFDWVTRMPQMRLLRWWVARRAVRMRSQGLAIDLGCGPGLLVLEMARQSLELGPNRYHPCTMSKDFSQCSYPFGSGWSGLGVVGLDLAEEMVSRGEENARLAGLGERVSFRLGDVKRIPFPDHSLDLVVSTLSLHHWGEPLEVLDEVARVLRPGGSFLLFDLRRDMSAPAYLLLWFAQHVVLPPALRRVNEPLGSRDAAYTPQEAAELAGQSRLSGWQITTGPLWLTIEGSTEKRSKKQEAR